MIARREGIVAVTLRAVAAEVGVTPALVAHYVRSMDELVAATFADIVAAELDDIRDVVRRNHSPGAQLGALIATLIDGSRDDVTRIWVQSWSIGRRNESLADMVRDHMDRWQRLLAELIDEGCAVGAFRVDDSGIVAAQILGMIDGLNAHSLVRWTGGHDRVALLTRSIEALLGAPAGTVGAS